MPDRSKAERRPSPQEYSKADGTLSLSQLQYRLGKVPASAARGLANDYVVMTNASVISKSEAAICEAFEKARAKTCRVFEGS